MIALDTNLLARLLLRDDRRQHDRVLQLLAQDEDFTAPITVMLELVWVLEVNDCSAEQIAQGLELLLALPNFKPAEGVALRRALPWYAQGMDIADALHVALSPTSERLATFDKAFVSQGKRLALAPPVVAA